MQIAAIEPKDVEAANERRGCRCYDTYYTVPRAEYIFCALFSRRKSKTSEESGFASFAQEVATSVLIHVLG